MRNHHSSPHDHEADGPDARPTSSPHSSATGLSLAADGLQLVTDDTTFEPGTLVDWAFRILDADGTPIDTFDDSHGQLSHLIIVRRDLIEFQHLHPRLGDDGTWYAERLVLPSPGVYRAFVDVVIDGRATTLGLDLFAAGEFAVDETWDSTTRVKTDGYEIERQVDRIDADESALLSFTVRRADGTIPDLDPYLGARGHLVALRRGDLAYLHVHPRAETQREGVVEFDVTFPTPGDYRVFLQTKPDSHLITAPFDVDIDQ